jgi:hypothetical protein
LSPVALGITCGAAFGAIAVGMMIPMAFPDKRAALTAAFLNRFAIGLVICVVSLSWPSWFVGLFFGLLLSLPAAIITKAWAPIVGIGAIGGVIIALISAQVAR